MAIVLLVPVELGLVGAGSVVSTCLHIQLPPHQGSSSAKSGDCGVRDLLPAPFVQPLGFGLGDAFALALEVRLSYRKISLNAPSPFN
jgi:hypothetical protein